MTLPNFILIGAPKCGTTSVYHYLQQHPDVYMSPMKEPQYFTFVSGNAPTGGFRSKLYKPQPAVTELKAYEALFAAAGNARAIGEASVSYLYSQDAPHEMHALIPDVRLIAILRNPAERAFSNFLQARRHGREPLETFEAALAAEDERVRAGWGYIWHYFRKGLYAEQLGRYRAEFAPEQMLVMLYDDLVRDPRAFMRRLHGFVGVRDDFEPDLTVSSNVSGMPKGRITAAVLPPAMALGRYWLPLVPDATKQWMRQRLLAKKPQMPPETRQVLIARYEDDMRALEQMLDRDLSHWRQLPSAQLKTAPVVTAPAAGN